MKIGVIGHGKMAKILKELIDQRDYLIFVDTYIYERQLYTLNNCDVLIDVSHPNKLDMIIEYCQNNLTPICIATTGYNDKELQKISNLSLYIPVLYSANYSIGLSIINQILQMATPILKASFDIEIVEKHHNQKIDAPSGSARMLFDTINKEKDYTINNARDGISLRNQNEIGIHSIRGGTLFGEHEVFYIGEDEEIIFTHRAYSRMIFAQGMLLGSSFISAADIGLYDMKDVLFKEKIHE